MIARASRSRRATRFAAALALGALAPATGWAAPDSAPEIPFRVVAAYPHDRDAFTQGLVLHRGVLLEGTGLKGRSSLREVRLETGKVVRLRRLPDRYFGEGVTAVADRIVQLTWTAGVGFVYELDTFAIRQRFRYAGEGWGLTFDGDRFVMSDGSARLRYLDAGTYRDTGGLDVTDGSRPLANLNELEFALGSIWANVWKHPRIARIDPGTGRVTGWLDLTALVRAEMAAGDVDVLNGIAWDAERERLLVTGKRWRRLYALELIER